MATGPNVLVFVTHDTGRHLGCYGVASVQSPRLDQFAASGLRFDRFHATAPMCSPSRAAMFSGLYAPRNGVLGLTHSPWYWRYNSEVKHLSHHFKAAGYRTTAIGIIHESYRPMENLGFDEHLEANQGTDVIAKALPKLGELARSGEPFYVQMGIFQTHRSFCSGGVVADASKGVSIPEMYVPNDTAKQEFAELQGSIRHADNLFGQVLDELEANGLAENTIVVFTVDHGIDFPRAKGSLYDPGLSVALLMRWPGHIAAGRTANQLLSNIDLTPTLLELAGIQPPTNLDGISFAALCRGDCEAPVREALFAQHTHPNAQPDLRCIRTQQWKLIRSFFPSRRLQTPIDLNNRHKAGFGPDACTPLAELYDLHNDPLELTNLAGDPAHQETLAELNRQLLAHLEAVKDPILEGPIRWPFYTAAVQDLQACRTSPAP